MLISTTGCPRRRRQYFFNSSLEVGFAIKIFLER